MSIQAPQARSSPQDDLALPKIPKPLDKALMLAALVATALLTARALLPVMGKDPLITPYKVAQFWVSYDHGFVRRGLPGTVLQVLSGGQPTEVGATIAGALLVGVGVAAMALIAWQLYRNAYPGWQRLAVATLIVVSPFTLSLLVRDLGRYDSLATAAILGIAAAATSSASLVRRRLVVVVIAVTAALAAATLEFLVAPLAGVALCALIRMGYRSRQLWFVATLTMLPAVAVSIASLWAVPQRATLLEWVDESAAAQTGVGRATSSAISALAQQPAGLLKSLAIIPPGVQVLYLATMGGCFAGVVVLLWRFAGAPRPGLFWGLCVYYMACAVALSVVGIDYRRWWAFVFIAMVGCLALLGRGPRFEDTPGRWWRVLAAIALVGSVVLQVMPYYPRWVPAATATFTLDQVAAVTVPDGQ